MLLVQRSLFHFAVLGWLLASMATLGCSSGHDSQQTGRSPQNADCPLPSQRGKSLPVAVVFIPGIMGSELSLARSFSTSDPAVSRDRTGTSVQVCDDQNVVIFGENRPSTELLKLNSNDSPNKICTKLLDKYHYQPVPFPIKEVENAYGSAFKDLLDTTRNRAQLVVFSYDWRRDISETASQLNARLGSKEWGLGHRPVIIVAHSMGGLVAWYWQQHLYNPKASSLKVRALVLVGAPLKGSCIPLKTMFQGIDYARVVFLPTVLQTDIFNDANAAQFTFPSLFELLMSSGTGPQYCLRDGTRKPPESVDLSDLNPWESKQLRETVLRSAPWNSISAGEQAEIARRKFFNRLKALISAAKKFQTTLSYTHPTVPTKVFASKTHNTIDRATLVKEPNTYSGNVHEYTMEFSEVPGDGTVTWASAVPKELPTEVRTQVTELRATHENLLEEPEFLHYLQSMLY
jgi:pimeloyl-ACP methyl ester carboxylesterase